MERLINALYAILSLGLFSVFAVLIGFLLLIKSTGNFQDE